MFLDIAIGALLISSMFLGYRTGFVYNLLRTFEWIFALIIGVVLHPLLKTFLINNTGIADIVRNNVTIKLSEATDFSGFESMLPPILRPSFQSLANSAVSAWSDDFSDLILAIISFLILLFLLRFILSFVTNFLSKKKNANGLMNFTDGILGMIFGFISSFILVSVLFMMLFPTSALLPEDMSKGLNSQLKESHIAYEMWNNNLLLAIVRDVNSDD